MAGSRKEPEVIVIETVTITEPEPVYSLTELMAASRQQFGVQPEVVAGAAHAAGRLTEMTLPQARAAIAAFLKMEA